MEKIFVLDTNVLIHNPQALFTFQENRVVIPIVVIEEIDNFKKGVDEKSRNARQIGRYLDALRENGSLQDGVKTEAGGHIQVALNSEIINTAKSLLFIDRNDNLIIGTALYFKKNNPDKSVILISMDANVRIKADAVGLLAENYEEETAKYEEYYTGWTSITVDESIYNTLKQDRYISNSFGTFYPNQFVRIENKNDKSQTLCTRYYKPNNMLNLLNYYHNQEVYSIRARNFEQEMAFDILLDDSIKLVSLSGKAGTGKTLLAIAAGLQKVVNEQNYSRLVVSRPIFPMGKDLGYLPGSKTEKFNPWMQPIYDNMEILLSSNSDTDNNNNSNNSKIKKKTSVFDLIDYGFVELEPLTYIRGRSLPNQFIIIDEAQNLSPHEMKTIITRAGENTKIVLTGDPYQIDIPYLDSQSNGLSVAVEKLKEEDLVAHITLDKGERSALADLAAKYF